LTTDRIRDHATRLGLTHLTDTITELVERAETGQMGYLDFVDLLLEEEVGLREGRRFRNALKLSGLPHHKTLDEFDFAFQPGLDARKIRDLATLECSSRPSPTWLCSDRPESAKPCSPSRWPSLPAKPDSPSTSPPSTT
jgi:DNA replication protein DnaC